MWWNISLVLRFHQPYPAGNRENKQGKGVPRPARKKPRQDGENRERLDNQQPFAQPPQPALDVGGEPAVHDDGADGIQFFKSKAGIGGKLGVVAQENGLLGLGNAVFFQVDVI